MVPVDKFTGKKITPDCDCNQDDMIAEVFQRGTEPTEVCNQAEKELQDLPWYLQKRVYDFDPQAGYIKPERVMIDYASQKRALRFMESVKTPKSANF